MRNLVGDDETALTRRRSVQAGRASAGDDYYRFSHALNLSASPPVVAVPAVPEPASLALAGLDLFAAFAARKRG